MQTVYRVEHIAYRHGPYFAGRPKNEAGRRLAIKLDAEFTIANQPPPCLDGIQAMCEDLYCGFDSLEKLYVWFEQWLDDLEAADYHVAVFEVPVTEVLKGRQQVVFPRKKYRRKTAMPIYKIKESHGRRLTTPEDVVCF